MATAPRSRSITATRWIAGAEAKAEPLAAQDIVECFAGDLGRGVLVRARAFDLHSNFNA
jgi:hypothetical protein